MGFAGRSVGRVEMGGGFEEGGFYCFWCSGGFEREKGETGWDLGFEEHALLCMARFCGGCSK